MERVTSCCESLSIMGFHLYLREVGSQICAFKEGKDLLGSVFGRTDFSRILFLGPPDFFGDFVADFFLTSLWEKVPRKGP